VEYFDMPKTLDEVSRDAAELEPADQLKLARLLIDLSETQYEDTNEVQAAWDAEIQRRLQDLRSGKVRGIPLDEVKRRMQSHLVRED
jgi:putative addiction module component (TIGR02574 family)